MAEGILLGGAAAGWKGAGSVRPPWLVGGGAAGPDRGGARLGSLKQKVEEFRAARRRPGGCPEVALVEGSRERGGAAAWGGDPTAAPVEGGRGGACGGAAEGGGRW